jgi:hypothetical protein
MKALREKRSRELAEKKKRLEDLRKKKAEARAGAAAAEPAAAAPAANDGAFDEYINSVLESTAPAGAAKAESEAAAAAAETAGSEHCGRSYRRRVRRVHGQVKMESTQSAALDYVEALKQQLAGEAAKPYCTDALLI